MIWRARTRPTPGMDSRRAETRILPMTSFDLPVEMTSPRVTPECFRRCLTSARSRREAAAFWSAAARYGTPRAPVDEALAAGRPALLEIDLQGARQVRERMPGALFVFLAPPSWDELVSRLVGRGTEDRAERERRLETAREEMAAEREFDAVVVNREIPAASEELVTLMRLPR